MTVLSQTKSVEIRRLNDAFRKSFVGGRVLLTRSVQSLPPPVVADILAQVRGYDRFEKGNDPYGEHDFVSIQSGEYLVYGKIDYYDKACLYGSEDPSDPEQTTRVLTIMLAEDY